MNKNIFKDKHKAIQAILTIVLLMLVGIFFKKVSVESARPVSSSTPAVSEGLEKDISGTSFEQYTWEDAAITSIPTSAPATTTAAAPTSGSTVVQTAAPATGSTSAPTSISTVVPTAAPTSIPTATPTDVPGISFDVPVTGLDTWEQPDTSTTTLAYSNELSDTAGVRFTTEDQKYFIDIIADWHLAPLPEKNFGKFAMLPHISFEESVMQLSSGEFVQIMSADSPSNQNSAFLHLAHAAFKSKQASYSISLYGPEFTDAVWGCVSVCGILQKTFQNRRPDEAHSLRDKNFVACGYRERIRAGIGLAGKGRTSKPYRI